MPKPFKKFIIIITFFALTLNILLPAMGAQLDNYYKEQQNINNQIDQAKKQLNAKEKERQKTLNELNSLNRSMETASRAINDLDTQLSMAQQHIEKIIAEISQKEADVDGRTKILEDRLTQIYIQGDVNFLEVLLQSTSLADFLNRFELFKSIAKNDSELLKDLEEERKILNDKKKNLENKKNDLDQLKSTQEKKKNQLQIASVQHKQLVSKIEQQKEVYKKMLDDLEEQSRIIGNEILKLQSKDGNSPGWLQWPTPGQYRITSPYGWRNHPILKERRFHTGVDIAAPYGSDAVAAADGKVIFTGARGGYGNTIIVDHGGGMATMYPHLSRYLVKVGDIVKRNQAIGKIGTSGWSTGPHIHFEVRIDGNHTNPMPYLKK